MSQDVTYADLHFTGASREGRCRARREGGAELTYNNFFTASSPLGKAPPSGPKGPNRLSWLVVLGLATAALLLLATAAGLGLLYQQVSQQLREAPPACAAGNGSLGRRRADADAEPEPEPAGDAERGSSLQRLLRRTQEARRQLEEALNASRAQPCSAWCPEQWVLLRRKCLFFARERKTWEASWEACEAEAARLLITKSWEPVELPGALQTVEFWIGLQQHSGDPQTWAWVDGTNATHAERAKIKTTRKATSPLCVLLKGKDLSGYSCNYLFPYICEKVASAPTSREH